MIKEKFLVDIKPLKYVMLFYRPNNFYFFDSISRNKTTWCQ